MNPDQKPDQFCVGRHDDDITKTPQIFVIDFGLATSFREDGRHIKNARRGGRGKHKTGTARYASVNVHNGSEHTRRDDLESLAYILIELLRGYVPDIGTSPLYVSKFSHSLTSPRSLPWIGMRAITAAQGRRKIGESKTDILTADLTAGMPEEFATFLEYARELSFAEEPDYEYCKGELVCRATLCLAAV